MQPIRVDITITTGGVTATASRLIGPRLERTDAVRHEPGATRGAIAAARELAGELADDAERLAASWAARDAP